MSTERHLELMRRQAIDQKARVAEAAIDFVACGGKLSDLQDAVNAYLSVAHAVVESLQSQIAAKEG